LDSGETLSIPRQILQAQKSQIVYLYQQHCDDVGVDPMSDRTVYSILDGIHAREQKIVSGVDEFVKNASEAWSTLQLIIQQLPIPRQDKHEFNTVLERSKLYLQSKYGNHCGETEQTTTHCTAFALSQLNNAYYSQSCDHIHHVFCEGKNIEISSFY
jgi:hypothetical protein